MPRRPRLDAPGTLHHVMVRGLEPQAIFWDDHDRNGFLERLATLASAGAIEVYAWALLPNHAHVLLRTGTLPLARTTRSLLTGQCGAPSIATTTGTVTSSGIGTSALSGKRSRISRSSCATCTSARSEPAWSGTSGASTAFPTQAMQPWSGRSPASGRRLATDLGRTLAPSQAIGHHDRFFHGQVAIFSGVRWRTVKETSSVENGTGLLAVGQLVGYVWS